MVSARELTESVTLTLVARIGMVITPVAVMFFGWITYNYLDTRFQQTLDKIINLTDRVQSVEVVAKQAGDSAGGLSGRVTVLETSQSIEKQASDSNQRQILDHLGKIDDTIGRLSVEFSGLNATVRERSNPKP